MPAKRRLDLAIAAAIPIAFLIDALHRAYPFQDDVPLDVFAGDDWWFYKRLAVSILDGGLRMPGIHSYVLVPHGFIYPYFLAAVFFVAGVNSSFVYVLQATLAGGAISVLWWTCRDQWRPRAALVFLVLAVATTFIDFGRGLSFRLLSESLFLFLFAAFLATADTAVRRVSRGHALVAGILLGLSVLSRTSVILAALAILTCAMAWASKRRALRSIAVLFLAGFALGMSPLPVREAVVTGRPNIDLITKTDDFVRAPTGLGARGVSTASESCSCRGSPRPLHRLTEFGRTGWRSGSVLSLHSSLESASDGHPVSWRRPS